MHCFIVVFTLTTKRISIVNFSKLKDLTSILCVGFVICRPGKLIDVLTVNLDYVVSLKIIVA